jgi:hypothetical protein
MSAFRNSNDAEGLVIAIEVVIYVAMLVGIGSTWGH